MPSLFRLRLDASGEGRARLLRGERRQRFRHRVLLHVALLIIAKRRLDVLMAEVALHQVEEDVGGNPVSRACRAVRGDSGIDNPLGPDAAVDEAIFGRVYRTLKDLCHRLRLFLLVGVDIDRRGDGGRRVSENLRNGLEVYVIFQEPRRRPVAQ